MFINLIQQRFFPWLITLLLSFCSAVAIPSNTKASIIKPSSYTDIQAFFTAEDYHWDNLHQGVPDIRLHCFPADLNNIEDIQEKKHLFYMSLLPMVLAQNNAIQQQRLTLKQILQQFDRSGSITLQQQTWLKELGQQYHCDVAPLSSTKVRGRLLNRVNVVPAALVIAQAANESAYGTSRFARIANNIFGEWTFKVGTGIVPLQRSTGQKYEVKKFATLNDSLISYFNNINTHRAYKKLRDVRQQMSAAGKPIDAQKLAEGLINYSTRRDAYVAEIQAMIRYNRLCQLSTLELRSQQVQIAEQPSRKNIAGSILRISELSSRVRAKRII
ncbi:MAG: glucosaminidase domain-containing protein [Desulfuromonas sp.]|nr:glucosaminidase domain-containing protein [Desulfuromonas sp.]